MRPTFRHRAIVSAAALALSAGGLLAAAPAPAGLAHGPAWRAGPGALQRDFAAAAREFHVPVAVLLGVAYQESRWDGHRGSPNTDGGYGLMDLTDVPGAPAALPALHTLTAAARLTRAPAAGLRADDLENLRGGAALLASYERRLTGGTPADPAAWYAAVATYSRSADQVDAQRFADEVYRLLATGARRATPTGQWVRLGARPRLRPERRPVPGLRTASAGDAGSECPADMRCALAPAASQGYQRADRPADGLRIRYLVIHDTEGGYGTTISSFQDPADGAAAHYVMRSSDGAVTQMVRDEDLAFHAGNYWFNMHSIGIEHEGFAAQGATWYTEAQYRATADLVRYLASRYGIPLDRRHVIGHDNVPGPASAKVAGMHWDPGPYWDWTHFMELLGTPAPRRGGGMPAVGSAVTIAPDFAGNAQTVRVCAPAPADTDDGDGDDDGGDGPPATVCHGQRQASNFLYVRTAPSAAAPLFRDPSIHPSGGAGSQAVDDWGDTVSAGQQFVVAGRHGDWTAIWFGGAKVWFANPGGAETAPAPGVTVVSPTGSAAPVYGQAYPRAAEYPAGLTASAQRPLAQYTVPAGQAYVASASPVRSDDFFSTRPPDTVVTGSERYWTVQYDHRLALLDADDVSARGA